ncbi:MAG: hypothetical protein KF868_01790 [Acidobacteria bacterium]|nr:hypothetical protein [Acidobacteriota bacterium]
MNVKLMLDASGENTCPDGFLAVESEVEFLRREGNEQQLFVSGERLCQWARELCRGRGLKEGTAYVDLPSPRNRLRLLVGDWANEVQADVLARAVDLLQRYPHLTRGGLLAQLTGEEFWAEAPSQEHAARWLLAKFGAELTPLVDAAREMWARDCGNEQMRRLYKLPLGERQSTLKEWLNAEDEWAEWSFFPLAVEGEAAEMLKAIWGQKLRQTNGQAIEKFPTKNPNARCIAAEAYDYFRYHASHLTLGTVALIGPLLSPQQRSRLERLVPRDVPAPLPVDASEQVAVAWAVQQYLPYREWQVAAALDDETTGQAAEEIGESFANWLLENYPRLTTKNYADSPLNIRTKYVVSELSKSYRVLWVVVDGLNYLNHRRLLQLLATTEAALTVEEDRRLLAVLPTITEQAKYGMTSGLLPRENLNSEWEIRKVLGGSFPQAKYAGVEQVDKLKAWLADKNIGLCYWNMTAVDDCYHKQTDADAIQHNIEARLDALAKNISAIVAAAENPDRVAVVISTDHGQMLGPCVARIEKLNGAKVHGRTAKGDPLALGNAAEPTYVKAADSSAVLLNETMFQLGEPMTLALRSYYFGGWAQDSRGRAWGVHGGLFPEEVIVGLSVLRRHHQRKPVMAGVRGIGEVGKPGRMTFWVDNPNPAPLCLLTLTLNEVAEYRPSLPLNREVEGLSQSPIELELQKFPAPLSGDSLSLTGTLIYEFGDGVRCECAVTGTLICKQMYSGQRPSLRDRFKK